MYINKRDLGSYGEDLACSYLENLNYLIKCKNFSSRNGEIDIICFYNNILVFVEVKSRYNCNFGNPIESINYSKINSIKRCAQYYLYKNRIMDINIRFDIIEIKFNYNNNNYNLLHTIDAFRM